MACTEHGIGSLQNFNKNLEGLHMGVITLEKNVNCMVSFQHTPRTKVDKHAEEHSDHEPDRAA